MISLLPRYIFNFVFFILLQVLILNNFQFSGYINPYLYVIFILTLPFETPGWFLILLGFITGLTIDVFCNTLGMHAAATVFLAFLRPYVLSVISPRDGYEPGTIPIPAHYGRNWFFKYTVILVVSHHLLLFFVEAFSFSYLFETLWRVIISSIFTIALIFTTQLFNSTQKRIL